MTRLSVIIPAYDEADGIAPTLEELVEVLEGAGLDHEVLVVDDGSTDGTRALVEGLGERLPSVRVLAHPDNRGYGAALKTGIREAAAPLVAITDADRTYPAAALPALVDRLTRERAAMVVGARIGPDVHIPLERRPMKAVLRWLASYVAGRRIPDLNSGLRVFDRRRALEQFHLISDGFSFTTTITLAFMARELPVLYEPIDYRARTGSSKIRPIADTLNFLKLILRVSIYFNPMKVFMPVAALVGVAGLAWGVRQWWEMGGLGEAPVLLLVSALQIFLVGLIADMISRRPD